jgi:BspA type Leucine rich repeat region (6 copies)
MADYVLTNPAIPTGTTRIVVDKSVTSLRQQLALLDGSDSVTTIRLHSGIDSLCFSAFSGLPNLTTIENLSKVKRLVSLPMLAFYGCNSLTSIDLGGCVKLFKIEPCAFCSCIALRSIRLPDSVRIIGNGAFFLCDALKDVTIPCKVTVISEDLLFGCHSLLRIHVPLNVTEIQPSAFARCTSLRTLTFAPEGECRVGHLGSYFLDDTNVKTFTLPSSVISVAVDAFDDRWNKIRILLPWGLTEDGPFQSKPHSQHDGRGYPKLVLTIAFVLLQRAGIACGVPIHHMHRGKENLLTATDLVNVLTALMESTRFTIPRDDPPDDADSDDNTAGSEGSVDPDDSSLAEDNDPLDHEDSDHSDWDAEDSLDDSSDSEEPEDSDSLDSDNAEPKPEDCIDHDYSAEDHCDRVLTQAIFLLLKTFPSEFFGNGGDHQAMDVHPNDAVSATDPVSAKNSTSPRNHLEEEALPAALAATYPSHWRRMISGIFSPPRPETLHVQLALNLTFLWAFLFGLWLESRKVVFA